MRLVLISWFIWILIEYLWHLDAASVGFSCRLPIFPREKRGKVQIMGAIGEKKKR